MVGLEDPSQPPSAPIPALAAPHTNIHTHTLTASAEQLWSPLHERQWGFPSWAESGKPYRSQNCGITGRLGWEGPHRSQNRGDAARLGRKGP